MEVGEGAGGRFRGVPAARLQEQTGDRSSIVCAVVRVGDARERERDQRPESREHIAESRQQITARRVREREREGERERERERDKERKTK